MCGLALDAKNNILFAACRDKNNMIILSATDGHIITDLPIGVGCDGATFNAATMEVFSSQGDGTTRSSRKTHPPASQWSRRFHACSRKDADPGYKDQSDL